MNSLKPLPIIILLCCSVAVHASTNPEDIRLSFPFFQSGQSSGIRDELMVGYGDYCFVPEQLHMGIDFFPESEADQVLNPFNTTMYSIGAFYTNTTQGTYTGCHIGIGPEGSDYGWALEHMGLEDYDEPKLDQWCEYWARGKVLTPGMPIDSCIDYSSGDIPLHTHVQWSHWITDASPGGARIYNP
ncbi:MAG: hypothetical protein GF388_00415 [Candidatus Aegiribacteria sp.]|nr:hypothetical protein [Candidatus Aegiribacteria sp.]